MNTKQRKMQLVTQEKEMHVAAIAAFAKTEKANIVHQLFALMHGTHPKTKVNKNFHTVKSHPSESDVPGKAQTVK